MSPEKSVAGHQRARRPLPRTIWRALAGSAVCVTVVAGCTGVTDSGVSAASPASSGSSGKSAETTPTSSASTTAIEPGTTPPGTTLKLGEPAVLRYTANASHDSLIKLTVDEIKPGKLTDLRDFQLSDTAKKSGVFYVSATLKNTGDGDLGGQPLPLYGEVSADLVVPPVIFGTTFNTCDYQPLPTPFTHGDRATVCVVLLAPHHGTVTSVQWRAADNSEPITWTARH